MTSMPQLHRDARGKFIEVKRFREVVVCTELQKVDLVGGVGTGRDHDDGRLGRALAHECGELLAGETGKHEVADHEVEGEGGRGGVVRGPWCAAYQQPRLRSGICLHARVALASESRGDDGVDIGIVLDDEDAGFVHAGALFE